MHLEMAASLAALSWADDIEVFAAMVSPNSKAMTNLTELLMFVSHDRNVFISVTLVGIVSRPGRQNVLCRRREMTIPIQSFPGPILHIGAG